MILEALPCRTNSSGKPKLSVLGRRIFVLALDFFFVPSVEKFSYLFWLCVCVCVCACVRACVRVCVCVCVVNRFKLW